MYSSKHHTSYWYTLYPIRNVGVCKRKRIRL